MTDDETRRRVLGEIGSIKTPKKSESSRANIEKANERKRAKAKPCTCQQMPHTWKCPVYHQERARARYAAKKEEEEGNDNRTGECNNQ